MISRIVIGVVLLFGILLLTLPKRDEESLAKIASASMLMCTLDLRERVERQLGREGAVTVEFRNKCPELIDTVEVNELGNMIIVGKRHQIKMALNPNFEGGEVRWSCRGEPADAVTKLCKP